MDRQVQPAETAIEFVLIRSPLIWLLLALLIFSASSTSQAESLATKNRKGNELYAQGKYTEAEKKYLDAQVNNPGNSTVLYNLGNSLIRQKKYDQGIQALNQAIEKGDTKAKGNSWYNEGNALFAMEKYQDSADAFIQALKLNPADKDAKHNLELALMKLKQQQEQKQESKQSKSGEGKQDPENSKGQSAPEKEGQKKPNDQNQGNAEQRPNDRNEAAKQDMTQAPRREGAVNRERALQILDAIQNQEMEEQRKLLERRARQHAKGKDW
jgi:Ca-activated chloride channel homolog